MRRLAFFSQIAATLVACSSDSTAPTLSTDQQVTDFTVAASGTALTTAGGYDADLYQLRLFHALPDDLKLTADQEAKIKALVDAHKAATHADNEALNAIVQRLGRGTWVYQEWKTGADTRGFRIELQ